MPHVIEATILIGCAKDENVFISRIPIVPTDMPFEFKCLQFPVHLAFAMSINKTQGQSLKVAGINLKTLCVFHGQLYVPCSRVKTWKKWYVFAPNPKTRKIVYQTTLQSKLYPIGQFLLKAYPHPPFCISKGCLSRHLQNHFFSVPVPVYSERKKGVLQNLFEGSAIG